MAIEIPRDPGIGNKNVTKEIENYLLDIFSQSPDEPFSVKELVAMTKKKFSGKYGDDLQPHVNWAKDMLFFNKLIKRVAPGVFESIDGPDEIYSERETGHAPEGEFVGRGFDTRDTSHPKNKTEFNHEMFKADFGVRTLKNMGKSKEEVAAALLAANFNRVTLKLALKKYYEGADIAME